MTNNSVRKTVVEQELPDLAAVRAAGIELSLEHARAVLMLWSRVIAHGQGKARNTPYIAARVIRLAVSAQVPLPDGGVLEPLLLGGETVGVPDGKTALRRLGLDSSEITAVWHESAPFATSCLPLEWVLAFLPAGAWPLVAALIDCSPGELSPRIDEALRQHGRTTGPAPLRNDVTCLWQVMKILVALNRELQAENASRARGGRPLLELPESLAGWTALPERPSSARLAAIARGGRRRDVSAVPVDRIHGALVNTAKRAGWGKWRPSEWPPNRNWRALKEFAVLCLLVTACPRVDHLRLLDVDDFDPNHVFEDGTTAPGLRFRRAKMKGGGNSTDEYWKQLPADVADVLTAWIHCSGRQLGQPGEPLLISIATKDREPGQRYADGASLSRFVAGLKGKRRPIIPTIGNDWHGYASHRFRHTLNQVVERRYAAWKLEHPAHELASYDPRTFGELALDHTIKDLGYRDFRDRKRLEQILALGATFCWEECWRTGLQPHGLDPDAITRAAETAAIHEAELARITHELAALEARQTEALTRARPARNGTPDLDQLLTANTLALEIQQKLRLELRLKDDLATAIANLEHARTIKVALPEDLIGDDYERKLAEALAAIENGKGANTAPTAPAPLADELAVTDIAELYGVQPMQVRRWRAGKSNPPIDPHAWIKINQKDWRYPVSAINDRVLTRIPATDPQAALDNIRRRRAAIGFGNQRRKNLETTVGAA